MADNQNPAPASDSDAATLAALVNQLSLLLTELLTAARATTDLNEITQINTEYGAVQTLLTQATQAQMAADDNAFGQAVSGLKTQASMLTGMQAQIKTIVDDVGTAAKIVGYITQAVVLIGKL